MVEITGLVKVYPDTRALDGIDLTIDSGKIYGLLGPNGSGKSTLLKCIAGLLRPDQGQIKVFGQRPGRVTKAKVAYLPEIDYLYRWMTIGEIINFVAAMYPDWREDKVDELLKNMNLTKEQKINSLSKGMRARLKLVIAMARETELVLLDEPLSGLDPSSRGKIVDMILSEFRSERQSVILSTHEVGETENLYDEVIFLDKGTIRIMDQAEKLRQNHGLSINDLFREVFL
ncbi:MAG: ABC transporter ATP-binding protein [Firmicutes bacterium]|nr:ABC transporter ATP-binding protein [Bacillota bacterium]